MVVFELVLILWEIQKFSDFAFILQNLNNRPHPMDYKCVNENIIWIVPSDFIYLLGYSIGLIDFRILRSFSRCCVNKKLHINIEQLLIWM